MAETFTIGVSSVERPDVIPDYASIALWQVYRRQNVSGNAVDDELQLLSGTHSAYLLGSFWPTTTEDLTIKVLIQPHSSTIHHNGNWDGEVCLSGGTQTWKTKFNDIDITYRDIVLKDTQVYFEQNNNYHGDTSWWFSSVHAGNLTFDRCLIHTKGVAHTRTFWWSYEPQVSPSAFGTFEANYNNCVLEDTVGPVYPANGSITFVNPQYSHHTYNFKGCTLSKQSFLYAQAVTNYAPSASLTVNLSGCIEDTSSAAQPTLIASHPINLGYFPGGAGFPSGLSATIVDHITNQASGSVYDWAQTKTNVSYGVPFNFDGTVTSGEVNFVDNAGASSFRDYRLVADSDNLPVRYMDLSSIYVTCSKDITGFRRPGSTDAGAYQSISDRVISGTIGTGGTHATFSIFWNSQSSDEFLNGDTYQAIFKDGEYGRETLYGYGFNDKQVNLNIEIIGETPHNGNWGVGARFSEGIRSIIGGEASRQDINFLLKDVICRQTEGFDYSNNIFHNFNQRSGDYTGPYSRNPLTDQFTENVYHSKIMHENCLISLGSSGSPILNASGRNFASLGHDCVIDDRPGEHPRPYNNILNGTPLNYTPNIVERGSLTLGFDNCLILGDKFGQGVSRIDDFNRNGKSTYHLKMNGCTVRDVESNGTDVGNNKIHYDLNGCLIETSGVGGQTTSFIDYGWQGSGSIDQSTFRAKDCIFSQTSSTLIDKGGYQIPNGSGLLENSIASGFVVNTQFGVPFTYDGTVTNGEVGFQAGGGDLSTLRTYYPVADPDNLPVRYMDLSSIWETCSKDITGRKRPGSTDAGAFQSVSNRIISGNIPAEYATPQLLYTTQDTSSFLNGDTYLAVIESGSSTNGTYLYNNTGGREVDLTIHMKGASSHEGNWDQGTIIVPATPTGYLTNTVLHSARQDIKLVFEDIVFSGNHTNHNNQGSIGGYKFAGNGAELTGGDWWAGVGSIGTAPELTSKSRNAYNLEFKFNNCMIQMGNQVRLCMPQVKTVGAEADGTLTQGITKGSFNNTLLLGSVTVGEIYAISPLYNITGQFDLEVIGSTFRNVKHLGASQLYGSVKVIGSIIETGPGGASGADDGYAESFLRVGWHYTSRNLTFSATDSIFSQASADLIEIESGQVAGSGMLINSIASGFVTNTQFGVPFTFDGTVTNGEVGFQAGGNALSTPRSYYPVADPDNLAVQYTDSLIGSRDIAEEPRPAEGDVGAFQSISTNVSSFSIGTSAEFNTFTLMHNTIKNDILNGDTIEAEFLSGTHSIAGDIEPKEVNHSYVLKAHASAYHNGDWNSGVNFSGGSIIPTPQDHSFSLTLKDIVVRNHEAGVLMRTYGTTNKSGAYKYSTILDSCLIETGSRFVFNSAWTGGQTLDDSGNVVEVHDRLLEFKNCAIHGLPSCQYVSVWGSVSPQGCAHIEANCIGTTFAKLDLTGAAMIGFFDLAYGGNAEDGSLTYNISGSLIGGQFTHFTDIFQGNGLNALKVFNFADSVFDEFPLNIPGLVINKTINETNVTNFSQNNNLTNVPFTFDGTVKSGKVCFVDNGGATSLPDLRLVADLDNLPVKYMTQDSLTYKDITGYKRPGGIDQRDAGAYQSISDKNTVYKIGTSGVDFPADYATATLWWSTNYNYANVLNGETHTLQFKSGEVHNPAAGINFNGTNGSVSANVNQSFVYSGQTPHNGNWDEGATLVIDGSTNGATLRCGKNSFNFTIKDLSLVVSGNASNRRVINVLPTHNSNYSIPGYFAPEHTYTFENFMARMDDGLSSIPYTMVMDQNYERITDEDLNILEKGTSKSIHKNCLYVGAASSNGVSQQGSLNVYSHQYETVASAFFQTEGCTFINSWFSNNRHSILTNLEVDHAGLIYYASESHLDQFGRQLALHSPNRFDAAELFYQASTAANNSKFVDCIFNNGAGDSIAAPGRLDRDSTWVIEPLPSEYRDSTSSTVEFYQPWNVWASALTNCSFRVPFNFDGQYSPSTVVFDLEKQNNIYKLRKDSFGLDYVTNASALPLYDIAGVLRDSDPNAGAYEGFYIPGIELAFGNVYINLYN